MNERTLRAKLKQPFNLENWKQIVEAGFPEATFYGVPDEVLFTRDQQRELAEHIHHIGEVSLDDGTTLAFIVVQLQKGATRLIQNRAGLRKLVDSEVIAGVREGAIIVYHQPDYKEWRISFYSETYDWDEKEGIIKEETNPKRYTFVVGGDETCRTAAERLHNLVGSASGLTIEDVMEAFSVEKVSKRFFDEYKHQYDKFVAHLTGEVWTKGGKQEVGEPIGQLNHFFKTRPGTDPKKEARDFVKKLLGRIVFLYFVQKKGWLGASSDEFTDGSPQFIRELFRQAMQYSDDDQFYSQWLRTLFFSGLNVQEPLTFTMPDGTSCFIPYLNGGLFDEDAIDAKLEGFTLPDTLFHNPANSEDHEDKYDRPNKRGFLDFLDAFNFTIHEDSPEDQTIGVDPEMLGHIFENLLEDNKEKGAYYTPKPIVHYMCQESLIEYLNTQLEGDDELRGAIEELIKKQETAEVDHLFEEILTALQTVKVCDPAIGSGAFPMGILQEIYQTVETIFYASRDDVDATWGLEEGDLNAADIKKQIIQHSIYGVDIEQGAVDIARLRFWLSLIVDEEKPTPLPNLEYKIVSGNSLISTLSLDGSEQAVEINWELEGEVEGTKKYLDELREILKTTVQKQKQYFGTDKAHGAALKEEIKELKIDALITQLQFDRYYYEQTTADKGGALPSAKDKEHNVNRKIKIAEYSDTITKLQQVKKNNTIAFNHFDWKLDFAEVLNPVIAGKDAGFDIVIANPPYLGESGNKEVFRTVRKGELSEFYMGKMDYFYFFLHLALNLAVKDAHITFITTNYYPTADGAENLRNDLKDRSRFLKLMNFNELKIFDSARGQHNMISILRKSNKDNLKVTVAEAQKDGFFSQQILEKFLGGNDERTIYRKFKSIDLYEGEKNYIRLIGTAKDSKNTVNIVLNRVEDRKSNLLGNLCSINQGVVSGCDTLTNRHIDKLSDTSNVELGDGIFVFDLTHQRDLQIVSSFDEQEKKLLKPFFKNSEINKFLCNEEHSKLLLYLNRDINSIDEYPNIRLHLNKFREILKDRREVREGKINYFELQWPRMKGIFEGEKICVPYRVQNNCFAHNNVDWFCRSDCYLITSNDNDINLKYLLSVLNSSLFYFWLYYKGKRKGETLELFYTPLSEIPICLPSEDIQQAFIRLAGEIENCNEQGRDTEQLELRLDLAVFELYNLTFEEASHVMEKKNAELNRKEFNDFKLVDLIK